MLSRCPNIDAIVQEVPDLLSPSELQQVGSGSDRRGLAARALEGGATARLLI
jgi:hypothetical protein